MQGIEILKEKFEPVKRLDLTKAQAEAVISTDGHILLLAVPGSGKTTVLVTRLGYMLYIKEIPPSQILTMTYTVSAAADMRARFASFFGEEYAGALQFRTINGVCAKIIMEFERSTGRKAFDLITDEKEISAILALILRDCCGGFPTESDIKQLRQTITYIKNMCLSKKEIAELGDKTFPVSKMYEAYCNELKGRRLMDYDDQMVYALTMLRSYPALLDRFSSAFKYICVDEAQDTSKIQHEIIALLSEKNGNLFMVGDEDQSIYGFRAAYPDALLSFSEKYPDAKILYMEQNFRSDGNIVSAADSFISKNIFRYNKNMRTVFTGKTAICRVNFLSRTEQYDYLRDLAPCCEELTAVLYRDNESAVPVIDRLERAGVEYRLKMSDTAFFSNRVVKDVTDIINFSENPKDTELFMQIYYKIGTYLSKEKALEACKISREKDLPVLSAALRIGDLPNGTRNSCRDIKSAFSVLKTSTASVAISIIGFTLNYREYLNRMGIDAGKLSILSAIGQGEKNGVALLERLDYLQNVIREHKNNPACRFILSTIHSAKGLEYDCVYLMDVCDGVFPENIPYTFIRGKNKRLTNEEIAERKTFEEERRLFYVGMTRAKKRLVLMAYKNAPSFFADEIFTGNLIKTLPSTIKNKTPPVGKTEIEKFVATHPEGSKIIHKKYGECTVRGYIGNNIVLACDEAEKSFDLTTLLQKSIIK